MEDALRRQSGVKNVHVAIQANVVTVTPKPNVYLNLAGIANAIKGAGFAPGDMTVSVVGKLEEGDGVTVFRIRAWPEAYPITPTPEPTGGEQILNADVDYASKPLRLEAR